MKRCSKCNRNYPDDNLKYCLSDGTPLVSVFETPEEATVIKAPLYVQQPASPVRQGTNPLFAYLAAGVLALLIGGTVVIWMRSNSDVSLNDKNEVSSVASNFIETKPNKEQEKLNAQKANLQQEQALLEKEKQKLAEERKKLEAQKNKSVEPSNAVQTISAVQPTERIKFRRGSIEETISCRIGAKRDFVLRTRNGQYLSATVNSNGGCVAFDNGSTNTSYTTMAADSYLNLVNKCQSETNFSLSIFVK